MPSIRYLAKQLRVSVITTKRAYDDLEAEGFLETTPGKGTMCRLPAATACGRSAMSQIEGKLSEIIDAAKSIGLTLDELWEITATLYREEP